MSETIELVQSLEPLFTHEHLSAQPIAVLIELLNLLEANDEPT